MRRSLRLCLWMLLIALAVPSSGLRARTLLKAGGATVWKYIDDGSEPGAGWREPGFDDARWKSGRAPLGYGDPGLGTEVGFGGNPAQKHVTTWFRLEFEAPELAASDRLVLLLNVDDGAIVYLNGAEKARVNLPEGPVGSGTLAKRTLGEPEEGLYLRLPIAAEALRAGKTNVLAVEVHQAAPASSDLWLDLALKVLPAATAPAEVSPAALDVVNAFNTQHYLGPGVKIPDGYFDGGRAMALDAQRHATSGREILWIDRARDVELAGDLAFARSAELRALPPLERIQRLAGRFHEESTPPGGLAKLERTVQQLEAEFKNRPLLIGDWVEQCQAGACRHRALLFKVLADEAGLDAALVRGNYGRSDSPTGIPHAWNEVVLGDGRRVLVDVMLNRGAPEFLAVTDPRVIQHYLKVDGTPWYGIKAD